MVSFPLGTLNLDLQNCIVAKHIKFVSYRSVFLMFRQCNMIKVRQQMETSWLHTGYRNLLHLESSCCIPHHTALSLNLMSCSTDIKNNTHLF